MLTEHMCHVCGAPMVIRHGRSGEFLGCSTFPKCRGTRSMPTGVFCPKDGGELVERRSKKRGTAFYALLERGRAISSSGTSRCPKSVRSAATSAPR